MGLLIPFYSPTLSSDLARSNNDNNNNSSSSSNPSPTRLGGFEDYLKAQNKRNIRQTLCYTRRYHDILQTGDASELISIRNGTIRRHAMEALTAYAKYTGCYDEWQGIRKRYSLKWTDGNESLKSLERFFNPDLSFDSMLARIREMIRVLPEHMGNIIKFNCLIGLRPSEAVESVRLLNLLHENEIESERSHDPPEGADIHGASHIITYKPSRKACGYYDCGYDYEFAKITAQTNTQAISDQLDQLIALGYSTEHLQRARK